MFIGYSSNEMDSTSLDGYSAELHKLLNENVPVTSTVGIFYNILELLANVYLFI